MDTLTIKIPAQLNTKVFDVQTYLAAKLYEDAILSAGQAAQNTNPFYFFVYCKYHS